MKKLRKKSIRTTLPLFLLFCIVGGAFIGVATPSLLTAAKDPIPLEEVDFDGDIEGLYVTGTLYGIYDCYCENFKNRSTTSKEYIIDANDFYYMGLSVDKKDVDKSDALMDVSWDFLDGKATYEELEEKQFEITGTISAIPKDSLRFYNEYINDVAMGDPSLRADFLPYYIEMNKVGNFTIGTVWVFCIVGGVFIFLGILFLVLAISGFYQKSIKKYIANSGAPEMTEERVERFFENTREINGMYYNNEFICGQHGSTTVFGETSKIAWIYTHVTKHKSYFITVSKTHDLVICFTDGTRHFVSMKSESVAQQHINRLSELCPQAIFGYSDELSNLFNRSLPSFLNLRYNQQNTDSNSILNE
jgi:hypothetical protein